jgi:diacylglycerol kinase (ATP)
MRARNGLVHSFNCAIEGILWAVRTQRHMRFHCLAAVLVVLVGLLLRVSALEFVLLVFAIVLVFFAELINTALEAVVDLASPAFHPLARRAKDVAAGAVLLASVGAAIMGYLALAGRVFPTTVEDLQKIARPPGELAVFSVLTVVILTVLLKAWVGHGSPLRGGMPSGHTAFAFAVAMAVQLSPAGSIVALFTFALAAIIGHSRIHLGIHNLQEVIAGGFLGAGVTWLFYFIFSG